MGRPKINVIKKKKYLINVNVTRLIKPTTLSSFLKIYKIYN